MNPLQLAGFLILALGMILIVAGVLMIVFDWQTGRAQERERRRAEDVRVKAEGVADSINALAKLVDALKGASLGEQLVVFGIVLLLIGVTAIAGSSI
jgi:uncharacterized membrane protein